MHSNRNFTLKWQPLNISHWQWLPFWYLLCDIRKCGGGRSGFEQRETTVTVLHIGRHLNCILEEGNEEGKRSTVERGVKQGRRMHGQLGSDKHPDGNTWFVIKVVLWIIGGACCCAVFFETVWYHNGWIAVHALVPNSTAGCDGSWSSASYALNSTSVAALLQIYAEHNRTCIKFVFVFIFFWTFKCCRALELIICLAAFETWQKCRSMKGMGAVVTKYIMIIMHT